MLKNWSRIALASFMVVLLGASAAFATTSRVRSLANVGDYISDDSAVNRWYSTLPSFANQVNVELGDWSAGLIGTRAMGWTQSCGDDGKWGTYRISLNENAVDSPGFWIGNPFYQVHTPSDKGGLNDPTGTHNNTPVNKWDLAGGWELGENMTLGVAFTHSSWNYKNTAAQIDASNSYLTLGAGITWTNNDNTVVDAVATFGKAGGEVKEGTATTKWDGSTAFQIAGRMFYDWKDNVTVVPMAEFATSDFSLQSDPTAIPAPNGQKLTDFMVGLGMNMDVNQDNMLVFALEFMNRKAEYSNPDTTATSFKEDTMRYLPTIRLALESHITSWLTTRVGAAKYLVKETQKDVGSDEISATPQHPYDDFAPSGFDWFLGCGFNVAEWTVDLELAHETPFSLGYWLTGYSAWGTFDTGPVARISAVYNY